MTSERTPLVPHISTSTASTPSPPENNTQPSSTQHTPARSVSDDATKLTNPAALKTVRLQTPSPAETRDSCYFTHRGKSAAARHTRTTTPSDHLSTPSCLSPSRSSGGSSDSGHVPCGQSSGGFLTPPHFQPDNDRVPYKSPASTHSLTMANLQRANTVPDNKEEQPRRKRRKHKCRHKKGIHSGRRDHSAWSHSGCQTIPTASAEHRHVCQGHVGHGIPRKTSHGTTDTYGNMISSPNFGTSLSGTATTAVRRWSSVEIGTHQIRLESTLPQKPLAPEISIPVNQDEQAVAQLEKRYRSSTFTEGAIDHDIVRAIRDTLTTHKLPFQQLETPASITLRRASGASALSEIATVVRTPITGGQTPRVRGDDGIQQSSQQSSVAYVITRRDIDSITHLVQANLRKNYRPHNRNDFNTPSRQSSYDARMSNSDSEAAPKSSTRSRPADIVNTQSNENTDNVTEINSFLQIQSRPRKSKSSPTKSVHEVLWQGSSSPGSGSSMTDEDEPKSAISNASSQGERSKTTPRQIESRTPKASELNPYKGDAFDPKNANDSINEWSWRLPQSQIAVVVTSSESESGEVTPASEMPPTQTRSKRPARPLIQNRRSDSRLHQVRKRTPPPRATTMSKPSLTDVVSFPPLPSRATNEWFSPLPAMDSPPLDARSLYDIGLDVNHGPKDPVTSSMRTLTPRDSLTSWVRTAESSVQSSRNPSIDFDPNYQIRRRSVVRLHPKSTPRAGETAATGSALGSSSGERRRSIAPIKRVQTIDNKQKGERIGTWSRIRPPSICPPVKTPSPAELAMEEEDAGLVIGTRTKSSEVKRGILDRLNLIRNKSPPTTKPDHSGIFGRLTGTAKADADPCLLECIPHVCDDCERDPRTPSIDWIG